MKTLTIGDLKARIPIIQGGMGVGISLSGLASAVANEGDVYKRQGRLPVSALTTDAIWQ